MWWPVFRRLQPVNGSSPVTPISVAKLLGQMIEDLANPLVNQSKPAFFDNLLHNATNISTSTRNFNINVRMWLRTKGLVPDVKVALDNFQGAKLSTVRGAWPRV